MISTRYRWRKLHKSENSPSRRYFVKIFRAWYPTAHLQRETYCGSQDSLEQLARKFANVFLFRRRFICNHSGLMLFILNHVGGLVLLILNSCEKHWPKVVLKQDHHFVFELSDFFLGPPRLFSVWRASQKACWMQLMICIDVCFDMFCVCKTLRNCVTKAQTCVWEQMASLGKSFEEWLSWLFGVHLEDHTKISVLSFIARRYN